MTSQIITDITSCNWDSLEVQWLRLCLSMYGCGFDPWSEAKIPHALWPKNQNIKQKQCYNKFNKDFKNGPHQKKILRKINPAIICYNKIKWKRKMLPSSFNILPFSFWPKKGEWVVKKGSKELQIKFWYIEMTGLDFPGGTVVKNLPAKAGDTGSIPGLGKCHMPQGN